MDIDSRNMVSKVYFNPFDLIEDITNDIVQSKRSIFHEIQDNIIELNDEEIDKFEMKNFIEKYILENFAKERIDDITRYVLSKSERVKKNTEKNQKKVIKWFKKGYTQKEILKKMHVRKELVVHTLKYWKNCEEIIPYENYLEKKPDITLRLVREYFEEDVTRIGDSIKIMQKNICLINGIRIGTKKIKNILKRSGYSYKNHRCFKKKRNNYKVDQKKQFNSAQKLTFFLQKEIEIFYLDEVYYYLRHRANYFWGNSKLEKKLNEYMNTQENKFRTGLVCYSKDRLKGIMIVNGHVSKHEFNYFQVNLIQEYPRQLTGHAIIWLDNARWHKSILTKNLNFDKFLHFNAAYSPITNFIELIFSISKNYFIYNNNLDVNKLDFNVLNSFYSIDINKIKNMHYYFLRNLSKIISQNL